MNYRSAVLHGVSYPLDKDDLEGKKKAFQLVVEGRRTKYNMKPVTHPEYQRPRQGDGRTHDSQTHLNTEPLELLG